MTRDPFDAARSTLAARMARGHLARTGHALEGYYVLDTEGVAHLVRTCGCGA